MLELRHVSSAYGSKAALLDISLSFNPGEILAIVGPNGGGKSTLLRTALGLQPKTSGEIMLDGQALETLTPRQIAQKVSYLPQYRNVPDITAQRFVMHGRFPYMSYPRRYTSQDREIVARALKQVDASDLASRSMKTLSGGQRQKVYLAMALAQESRTVLMDEPTTYLDISHQIQLTRIAGRLAAEGKAVVLVLHDLPLAFHMADRLALLDHGRLKAVGSPETLLGSDSVQVSFHVRLQRIDSKDGWQYYYRLSGETEE